MSWVFTESKGRIWKFNTLYTIDYIIGISIIESRHNRRRNTIYDAQNSINNGNHTTVRVQFLSQSKTKSMGLKLTFDIKDITLAEITITTSYYFFWDFTVLLKPFLDERWVKIRNTFERFRPRSRQQSFRHVDLLAGARPASLWCGTQSKMAESDIGVFGILFLPRHDKQKNISSGQSTLVHFSSLSLLLATVLQVQIEFIFRASLIKLADCCFDPHQYQVLKIASIPKHDKWNCWMARSDYSTWWYLPQYPVCNTTQHKRVVPHL